VRKGVYPGSFNPPTTAHLAISYAARRTHRLDVVVWSVSTIALAKEAVTRPLLEDRIKVLDEVASGLDWLEIVTTEAQLLVDIAAGFDVLIMGADKWHQIQDIIFYDNDPGKRDAAMRALPAVAVAPRPPLEVPPASALDVPAWAGEISSTAARNGNESMMLDEAAAFDRRTGAWSDPARYEEWIKSRE